MQQAEPEAVAMAGGEPARKLLVELQASIKSLQSKVQELEHRINQNSKNSSKPPSSDPPLSRKERRALERKRKKRSSHEAGGQPGHEGKHRQMAPPECVDERFEHLPECCSGCGESFEGIEEQVGDPVVHQQWELPEIERICSVRETCRLQRRSVLTYLTEAAYAAHHGQQVPSLVPP